MPRITSQAIVLICCSTLVFGQRPQRISDSVTRKAGLATSQRFDEQPEPAGAELYPFYGVVDKVLALKDLQAKVFGAAQLADMLWKYDESSARQLFEKTFALTDTEAEPDARELRRRLRQQVVVLIAKRDPAWAKRLIVAKVGGNQDEGLIERTETNIAIASALVADQPDAAIDFGRRSLQGTIDPSLIWFLQELRTTHEREADQLFLQALAISVQQPAVNFNDFAMLGTYIFTSPKAASADPASVIVTRVGNIGIVDITADRAGASPVLVHAFLAAAVEILSRPIPDAYQRQTAYALAYLLFPKTKALRP